MKTIQEIYENNEKVNNGYLSCDLSNFRGICINIKKALKLNQLERATDEMCCLTRLFDGVTDVDYSKYRIKTSSVYDRRFEVPQSDDKDSKTIIQNDFDKARKEIEAFICQNYKDGAFEITKEVLFELPYWCVDWGYYNRTNRRFIDACKIANDLVGYKGDEESSEYYAEDKERYGFEEIFCSHYNGGRVRASFKDMGDCLLWSYHGEAIEEDGLYWAEQPCY